ncbi:MAG TPA: hypothetical protein VKN36_01050 [Eudoraea sp.]|nr:hypothetical protein [Eudoraea sp.]
MIRVQESIEVAIRNSGLRPGRIADFLQAGVKLVGKLELLKFAIKLGFMEVERNIFATLPVRVIKDRMGELHCRRQRHAYLQKHNCYR